MATILEPIAEAGRVRRDLLPQRRVLVRFDFATVTGPGGRGWVLIEHGNAEICEKHAGFEEDLVVVVNDPLAFALAPRPDRMAGALRGEAIRVTGDRALARALPTRDKRVAPTPTGR